MLRMPRLWDVSIRCCSRARSRPGRAWIEDRRNVRFPVSPRKAISRTVGKMPSSVRVASVGLLLFLSGCEPDFDVDGAFFPAWLLCMAAGGVASILAHLALVRIKLQPSLGPPLLIYPSLYVLLTLLTWIVFFRT
jgi:hypothetical protein